MLLIDVFKGCLVLFRELISQQLNFTCFYKYKDNQISSDISRIRFIVD